jgi:hypothetical protein
LRILFRFVYPNLESPQFPFSRQHNTIHQHKRKEMVHNESCSVARRAEGNWRSAFSIDRSLVLRTYNAKLLLTLQDLYYERYFTRTGAYRTPAGIDGWLENLQSRTLREEKVDVACQGKDVKKETRAQQHRSSLDLNAINHRAQVARSRINFSNQQCHMRTQIRAGGRQVQDQRQPSRIQDSEQQYGRWWFDERGWYHEEPFEQR